MRVEQLGKVPFDAPGIAQFIERCKYGVQSMVEVELDDGQRIEMLSRHLYIHLLFWEIARRWEVPILSNLVHNVREVSNKSLCKIGTAILHVVADRDVRKCSTFAKELYYIIQELARFSIGECDEYARSISAYEYSMLYEIPGMSDITDNPVINDNGDPVANQEKLDNDRDKMWDILCTPHPKNALYIYAALGLINKDQIFHTFGQVGYKTDLNNTIHNKVIEGNYFDGLKNFEEYAVESLSAKRSVFGNQKNIPVASYFGRTQHLATSVISRIDWRDCGTQLTIPFEIDERRSRTVLWKNIVTDEGLVLLTPDNIDEYVGTIVQMRSPLKCRLTDGVCSNCAGRLVSVLSEDYNVGIYTTAQVSGEITQTILKEKHVVTNSVIQYNMSQSARDTLVFENNHLYVKDMMRKRIGNGSIAIKVENSPKIINMINGNTGKVKYSATVFGKVSNIIFQNEKDDLAVRISDGQSEIYFSREFIAYVQDEKTKKKIDGQYAVISLKGYNFKEPLFKVISVAYAMTTFVKDCRQYLNEGISKSNDAAEVLNAFESIIAANITINIGYIEIMIRAMMIYNDWDYRLPPGDSEEYGFGGLKRINYSRSIGSLSAFERMHIEFKKPMTTVMPKAYGLFDDFLNLKPEHKEY